MKTLAERLHFAMRCAGMDPKNDQSELARLVGGKCTPQTIQNILSGGQRTSKYSPRIAAVLGCDALWLAEGSGKAPKLHKHETSVPDASITGPKGSVIEGSAADKRGKVHNDGRERFDQNVAPAAIGQRRIPIISYVQAGMMTDVTIPFPPGEALEYILTDLDLSDGAFGLRIKGLSMLPEFREGDVVVIDPAIEPLPGDFVVGKNTQEEATFKKYRPRGTNERGNMVFELVPLNDDFPTLHSERDHLQIIGVMVEHRKYRRR